MKYMKPLFNILFLLFFVMGQSQENSKYRISESLKKSKVLDSVKAEIEKYLIDSDIKELWKICSKDYKRKKTKKEFIKLLDSLNIYFNKENINSFKNMHNTSNSRGIKNGLDIAEKSYKHSPSYVEEKINPFLIKKLFATFTYKLVNINNNWKLDNLKFKNIHFEKDYNILEYVKDLFSLDSVHSDQIKIIKNGDFGFNSIGILKSKKINLEKIKLLKPTKTTFEEVFTRNSDKYIISLSSKKTSTTEILFRQKEKEKYIEILFTQGNVILVSDSEKYGYFICNDNSILFEYIKKRLNTFANTVYN